LEPVEQKTRTSGPFLISNMRPFELLYSEMRSPSSSAEQLNSVSGMSICLYFSRVTKVNPPFVPTAKDTGFEPARSTYCELVTSMYGLGVALVPSVG
jgi:hypothetical protein